MFKLEIQQSDVIHTDWGTARINNKGYYQITTRKEKNKGKLLHRLIWEKWYDELSSQTHLHHIDENPKNNCIWNLEPMSKANHHKLHNSDGKCSNIGRKLSNETKMKMSQSKNKTGYYRVDKQKSSSKQGFIWRYQYYENSKNKVIGRVKLDELEREVKNRGLKWERIENAN